MSIDLRKHIVDIGKKAAFTANRRGIEGQRARVARVPDGRPRRTRADGDDCRKWEDPDRQLAGCYPRGGDARQTNEVIGSEKADVAEYGEWNRQGATLSDVTAKKEYGVDHDFIVKGIRAGKLEYREGAVWGNPYLRLLRSQLEQYIAEELGADYLSRGKNQTELRKIKKEIAVLKKRLDELEIRRAALERPMRK